jgi:hypothetical protein
MVPSPLLIPLLIPRTGLPAPYFLLRRTLNAATFHHLTLIDAAGLLGHWVMALAPDQLRKLPARVLLLWAAPAVLGPLEELEEGDIRWGLATGATCAETELAAGRQAVADGWLHLELLGQQLRGAFQLQRDGNHPSPVWWLRPG